MVGLTKHDDRLELAAVEGKLSMLRIIANRYGRKLKYN
jgi:hypothetical protein